MAWVGVGWRRVLWWVFLGRRELAVVVAQWLVLRRVQVTVLWLAEG